MPAAVPERVPVAAALRPFVIDTPQSVLDRIASRLGDSRVGYAPDDHHDWRYGMDASYLAELRNYWLDHYDWRAAEAALNRFPQFKAAIEGLDIHFYHVRGNGSRPFPIVLTHGWPGSVVEFQDVIPLLVADGWDVVVPSLPGYGWSQRPASPIGPKTIARLWRVLMVDVLGYPRFGAQGGDWGWQVTAWLGIDHPDVVSAIHLNFILPLPPADDDDAATTEFWTRFQAVQAAGGGYSVEQMTKPQTIGLALHDNPLGWAAWVVEKFHGWADTHGDIESRFTKDQLITNLMTYLVNDAMQSSIWLYYGRTREAPLIGKVSVPTGVACFPEEFFPLPDKTIAARRFNIVHWTEMSAGGHFAAFEEPEAFARDVSAFFGGIS